MGLIATIIEAAEELRGLSIPEDHQAVCRSQNIPLAGNAAGNTQNFLDLTGAFEKPPVPDRGPVFDPGCASVESCDQTRKRVVKRRRREMFAGELDAERTTIQEHR